MVWLCVALLAGQFDTTYREGLLALNRNDLPAAESHLDAAAQLEPHNPRVWLALAETYWKERKVPQAQTAARNAETWGAGDAVVVNGLSTFYSEEYYFQLAQFDFARQDFAAALESLDAGRKRFPQSAQLELAAGVACYGLRRFPEAIGAFLQTVALDPQIEQPYVFLGRMLDQAEGQLPRITQAFAAFYRRAPEDYRSSLLYGKALAMASQPARAEALLRESIARDSAAWEPHFELGVLLTAQRKYEEAAREIARSAELNPKDPVPHYHLAQLYSRLGKPAEAGAERALHERLAAAAAPGAGVK